MHRQKNITPFLVAVVAGSGAFALSGAGLAVGQNQAAQAASAAAKPGTVQAARHYHRFRGHVTSSHRSHHWFRMRTNNNRNVRIHTNRNTSWDNCDWDDMDNGHGVDVRAYRHGGRWVAKSMHNWRSHGDDHGHGNGDNWDDQ